MQNNVLFDVISQFGRRGREGLRNLKKNSFIVLHDAKNRKYVKMAFNEADKTHHGLDSREKNKEPRMYENPDKHCPVASFEKYISKLNPECPDFFQKPLQKIKNDIWYAAKPVGVNTLSSFMTRISKEAGLSRIYTNHCIRAYISTKLYESGFSNRAIMSVTGHRHENSLTSYVKPSEDERVAMSNALGASSTATSNQNHDRTPPVSHDRQTQLESVRYISPPTVSGSVDVNVLEHSAALHMFTGNVSNATININMYQK